MKTPRETVLRNVINWNWRMQQIAEKHGKRRDAQRHSANIASLRKQINASRRGEHEPPHR